MAKFYFIKARLLNETGGEMRLVWSVKKKPRFSTPVDVLKGFMDEMKDQHPDLGFDLVDIKEV